MGPKEVENYYKRLAQNGQALFKVIFKAAPGDDNFSEDDPLAIVTVVAKDSITGVETFRETSQMSAKVWEREVKIKVLNVLGVVKSMWYRLKKKVKPKPYEVTITVEPHKEWEKLYSPLDFPIEVKLGRNPPEHVWMLPKNPKRWLDKP